MHHLEGDSRVLCNFHPMCQFHFKTTHLAQILRISIFSFLLHLYNKDHHSAVQNEAPFSSLDYIVFPIVLSDLSF